MIVEEIKIGKSIQAILIRTDQKKFKNGTKFVTPSKFSFQLGGFNLNQKHIIHPHMHKKNLRTITNTSEVLFIKSGILRVDFYNLKRDYMFSKLLKKNDFILFNRGAHGFKVIKKLEMIEIKQGPFKKTKDKIRFKSIDEKKIKYK
jgi:mannose-6-phosphate isomerase-like protein (cupin superfamily)